MLTSVLVVVVSIPTYPVEACVRIRQDCPGRDGVDAVICNRLGI